MHLFRADLHIHSRWSRATSKALTLRRLAAWGAVKGLDILATGDFTHPGWRDEIKDTLDAEESGLFRLKDTRGLTREIPWMDGLPLPGTTRFILATEISSIYKRGGKVRKIHNLVYMPNLEAAEKFSAKLAKIGNLESDGRPILGLDARDLLEIVLETDPDAFLVPAHIWTPWFSLFGSKSGFDSIEDCYGDLSKEIFALETGLSSDPDMNRMWSALDRFHLVSNSDAHSGEKLGREANIFSGEPSYHGMLNALRGRGLSHKFLGTIEFFPEEGKYHMDGHRNCGVVLDPDEAKARGNICPVCGKDLTLGVLHRVLELADRKAPVNPTGKPGFTSLIPLAEVCSEVLGVGVNTKKVKALYARLISRFESETAVLLDVPPDELKKISAPLAEGIARMRRGDVTRTPGYDGEFGVIKVFTQKERDELKHGGKLYMQPMKEAAEKKKPQPKAPDLPQGVDAKTLKEALPKAVAEWKAGERFPLNEAQRAAADAGPEPVLVIAGPGTGKTRTLIGRVDALLAKGENPRHILAVTFTRRAAEELKERLLTIYDNEGGLPRADTLHALAFDCWAQAHEDTPVVLSEEDARRVFADANPDLSGKDLRDAFDAVALAREKREDFGPYAEAAHAFEKHKESWNIADYTDLLAYMLERIDLGIYISPYTQVLVDEIQDLSVLQLDLITALCPPGGKGFFGIGDPDQSIYSFRGAVPDVAARLRAQWPNCTSLSLADNYRSTPAVLNTSGSLMPHRPALSAKRQDDEAVRLFSAPDQRGEASWIAERIRELIGGTSHSLSDNAAAEGSLSPGDIGVLLRFKALIPAYERMLTRFGLPVSVPENDPFWKDPRVAAMLEAAGTSYGITGEIDADPTRIDSDEEALDHENIQGDKTVMLCPDKVVAKGPEAMAAYLQDVPPFDRLFFRGAAYKQLLAAYKEHGGWAALLNAVHLLGEHDAVRMKAEKIRIMSLHAAKGLEFEAVFLPALEDGILPFAGVEFLNGRLVDGDSDDVDEERRLLYVGMTRAKTQLYLSSAGTRRLYGKELRLKPSRFLDDIPTGLLSRSKMVGRKVRKAEQLGLMG
jgi:uncharacterized protein (TIGR00375 family)